MKTFSILSASIVLGLAGVACVNAQSTPVTVTAAPANFPGDTFGATTYVGNNGPVSSGGSTTRFFDVEGSGSGKFESFGIIDFSNTNPGFVVASVDPSLQLSLVDAPFSATRPGTLDFYLATNNGVTSGLKYDTTAGGAANGGVGNQLGTLYFLGQGSYTSTSASPTGADATVYNYNLLLPDAASESYFVSQLNAGPTGNLRFVVTSDSSTPNVVGSFAGSTNAPPTNSPTLTFNATPVPEPGALLPMALGSALVLIGISRRRRNTA